MAKQLVARPPDRFVTLDLSNVDFVTLFDWTSFAAILESYLARADECEVSINAWRNGGDAVQASEPDDRVVEEIYSFLSSLGTREVMNTPWRTASVIYPFVGEDAKFHYGGVTDKNILHGLSRIASKDDCKQFLQDAQIGKWRDRMRERFAESPLFLSDELWRVFCHELAVNVWEHAKVAGFLAARVVFPVANDRTKSWVSDSFERRIVDATSRMKEGFLELCVADAGRGFGDTLSQSFEARTGRPRPTTSELLAFAFDELGTSKTQRQGWATERHALGRILHLAAKYGGFVTLRSAGCEIGYDCTLDAPDRMASGHGYEPSWKRDLDFPIPGSQIQIVLPLQPRERATTQKFGPMAALPASYTVTSRDPIGHFLPLAERFGLFSHDGAVGIDEQARFWFECESLGAELLALPHNDALIIDFTDIYWTAGQFETLLFCIENVLQTRAVLLLQIDPRLLQEIVELQSTAAPTALALPSDRKQRLKESGVFDEISEERFLETYTAVHSTLLAIDTEGRRAILGVRNRQLASTLLQLVEDSLALHYVAELAGPDVTVALVRLVLNPVSRLFELSENQTWSCVWDPPRIEAQRSRAITRHFERVASDAHAWRRSDDQNDKERPIFNLPWEDEEWLEEFLESSRILSRERVADEIAQRLVGRLLRHLANRGIDRSEVKLLASITSPAMLLSTAMHRWWPAAPKPVISDLGVHFMLEPHRELPRFVRGGKAVVVQDILDTFHRTEEVVRRLAAQNIETVAIVGLIRFDKNCTEATAIPPDEWEMRTVDDRGLPYSHALVRLRRPARVNASGTEEEEPGAHWVEPRTLRPFPYNALRQWSEGSPDKEDAKRYERAQAFDDQPNQHVFEVGHFVYGRRHYPVALDVRALFDGPVGNQIATWLADVCQGKAARAGDWETGRGRLLPGDVTAILMPLHSHIHYLWPQVQNALAQRGRRQPYWMLDATLLLGERSTYRVPLDFKRQLDMAAARVVEDPEADRMRILILDDAMATARTAETILATLHDNVERSLQRAYKQAKRPYRKPPSPIQWIRYFAILNQMGHAQDKHWHHLNSVGTPPVPFVFEEYVRIVGIPYFSSDDCPQCVAQAQASQLARVAQHYPGVDVVTTWAHRREQDLRAVSLDSPIHQEEAPARLRKPIDLLAVRPNLTKRLTAMTAASAVRRFNELMYMSYPPRTLLASLVDAWPEPDGVNSGEYAKYRWAVMEWCMRKWPRVSANTARRFFLNAARQEVESDTDLVPRIFHALATIAEDDIVDQLVRQAVDRLVLLERELPALRGDAHATRFAAIERLLIALGSFFLALPADKLTAQVTSDGETLLKYLDNTAAVLDRQGHSFARNLYRSLSRPSTYADPAWALLIVAESLFRGRDAKYAPTGNHELLPKLIDKKMKSHATPADDRLLHGSLTLFSAALADLALYADLESIGYARLRERIDAVLPLLSNSQDDFLKHGGRDRLRWLSRDIRIEGPFCEGFVELFHQNVERLRQPLEEHAADLPKEKLEFVYEPDDEVRNWRVLTHIQRFLVALTNWSIDPAKVSAGAHLSAIRVSRERMPVGSDRLKFTVLTNYHDAERTREVAGHGRNASTEQSLLRKFGIELLNDWREPTESEWAVGYRAALDLVVPAGFIRRVNEA